MIPLSWYLILSAALFSIGLFGVLARRNAVAILLGIELMLNAVNINLVSFWRYNDPTRIDGQVFAIIVFAVAAAEVAVGLAVAVNLALQLRALVSPVDGSGLALLGAAWSPYQGLTLSAYVSAMAGDGNDLYAWDYGGPALTAGAEFLF